MASAPPVDKAEYRPPDGIALLPRDPTPGAPYPPPYAENDPSPRIGSQPPASHDPHIQPPGSHPPSSGQYPPAGAYPPPSSGSYPPPSGPYPPAGPYPPPTGGYPPSSSPYPPPQPGYAVPHVAYGPPQPSYPPQAAYSSGQMQGIYMPGGPITTQPTSWMVAPQNVPNSSHGLEFLSVIDQLVVHQEIELLEMITNFETENKYSVLNSVGQRVYYAVEESDCCARNCCGSNRPLDIKLMDNYGSTIINLHRPLACQSCCYPCCLQNMEVSSPPGTVIGTIEQQWSLCYPNLHIKNASGDTVFSIEGPCCTMACCGGDVDFKLMSSDGSKQVGKISKKWTGFAQEAFTDADTFGISFPMDLDVKMKAVVLGACFLIDMMYFERAPNKRRN